MKITEAAGKTGLSTETLRYYDRAGLVPNIKRDQNGMRYYEREDIEWILLMKALLDEGISFEMLLELASLCKNSASGKNAVLEEICTCLVQHRKHIDGLLEKLRQQLKSPD